MNVIRAIISTAVFIVIRPSTYNIHKEKKMYLRRRKKVSAKREAEKLFERLKKLQRCAGQIVVYVLDRYRPEKCMIFALIQTNGMALELIEKICVSFNWCRFPSMLTHANGAFNILLQFRLRNPDEDVLKNAGMIAKWLAEILRMNAYVSSVGCLREANRRFGDW